MSSLDVLTNSQFVAVFQGLCLCGPSVFHQDALNLLLNNFVRRLSDSSAEVVDHESMTFD